VPIHRFSRKDVVRHHYFHYISAKTAGEAKIILFRKLSGSTENIGQTENRRLSVPSKPGFCQQSISKARITRMTLLKTIPSRYIFRCSFTFPSQGDTDAWPSTTFRLSHPAYNSVFPSGI
jgi:hypothetical protein